MSLNEKKELIKQRLNQYYEAEKCILTSQEYRIGSRSVRRTDLPAVQKAIREMENQLAALEAGRNPNAVRMVRVVPRDL